MNGDGTGLVQLTDNLGDDLLPRWSPDGQKIAYVCGDASGGHVCVMNADGSGLTQLTQNQRGIEALAPAWSPDGTEITFHSNHDGNWEIYVMNVDGSAQTRLTDGPADDVFPAWSPDGQQIVFCSSRDGQYDLYLMDADSAGVNRLTVIGTGDPWETSNCLSNWAPDGTTIAFTSSHKFGHADIYVINVDGSGLTCLTCNIPGAQVDPSWSPDGTQILFDDNRGSLYAMSADGSNLIQLTSEERGHFPSLQP
jgi:Tol biopolymer transport system component